VRNGAAERQPEHGVGASEREGGAEVSADEGDAQHGDTRGEQGDAQRHRGLKGVQGHAGREVLEESQSDHEGVGERQDEREGGGEQQQGQARPLLQQAGRAEDGDDEVEAELVPQRPERRVHDAGGRRVREDAGQGERLWVQEERVDHVSVCFAGGEVGGRAETADEWAHHEGAEEGGDEQCRVDAQDAGGEVAAEVSGVLPGLGDEVPADDEEDVDTDVSEGGLAVAEPVEGFGHVAAAQGGEGVRDDDGGGGGDPQGVEVVAPHSGHVRNVRLR